MKFRNGSLGFSLIELMIACGLFVAVLSMAIVASHAIGVGITAPIRAADDERFLDMLEARLRSDATSSLGFTTIQGSAGASAASTRLQVSGKHQPDTGVEFAVTDQNRQWHHWSYQLQDGLVLTQDGETKIIDRDVSVFTAEFIPANEVSRSSTAGDAFANLPTPDAYTMNLNGQQITNGVLQIDVRRGTAHRTIALATRVTPSGFGIEAGPQWHATIHREAETHRSWGGLAQNTSYIIKGAVEYSTDNWKTAKTWCDHEIDRAGDTSANNVQHEYVYKDDKKIRGADKIFIDCQHDTHSREISETPAPPPTQSIPCLQTFSCWRR